LLKVGQERREKKLLHEAALAEVEEHLALAEKLPEEAHGIEGVGL